uniref:Uncharacterized protein n=1 Tax=Cannabis sativa TaxID=3483 RepID=A0A803NVH9_CANSA
MGLSRGWTTFVQGKRSAKHGEGSSKEKDLRANGSFVLHASGHCGVGLWLFFAQVGGVGAEWARRYGQLMEL